MKKYLLITIIALLALSCSDKGAEYTSAKAENATEQVDTSRVKTSEADVASQPAKEKTFREKFYESEKQNKESNSVSLFAYFLIFANIIATLFAIIYAFQLHSRLKNNERLFNQRMEKRKGEIFSLNSQISQLAQEIGRLRTQKTSSYQSPYSHATTTSPISGTTVSPQTPAQHNVEQRQQNQREQKKSNTQPARQSKSYSQVLYLEANSEDCFFQFYEQQSNTSKFVAHVIPGGVAATFEIIDVERIRSLNTSRSIKQAGIVAIKDAQGIKEQKPGKIHKITDPDGTVYWVIDEPVTVEFKK